jgi:CRISPR/Cas system-associated exonuclease Cas4 (RecB family)
MAADTTRELSRLSAILARMVAAEPVLSASSLKSFFRCPQQYAFSHIERIKAKPSVKQKLGIAAHAGVEHNLDQKIDSREDEPLDVVQDVYSTVYDREIAEVESPEEDPGKAKDQGAQLINIYHTRVAPDIQPYWVERQSIFRLIANHAEDCDGGEACSCGVLFSSTIDLVDEARQVRELKTTQRMPSQGVHLMQLAGQAIAFETETGEQVNDLIVDYLIRKKVSDYHQERWGGKVDAQMRRVFATQVQTAASMIASGTFPATAAEAGPGGPCSWCGYGPRGIDICPVWQKRKR